MTCTPAGSRGRSGGPPSFGGGRCLALPAEAPFLSAPRKAGAVLEGKAAAQALRAPGGDFSKETARPAQLSPRPPLGWARRFARLGRGQEGLGLGEGGAVGQQTVARLTWPPFIPQELDTPPAPVVLLLLPASCPHIHPPPTPRHCPMQEGALGGKPGFEAALPQGPRSLFWAQPGFTCRCWAKQLVSWASPPTWATFPLCFLGCNFWRILASWQVVVRI